MAVTWEREHLTTNWAKACQNYSKENKQPRELRERSPHQVVLSMPCWHITNWLVPRELETDFHILLVPLCLWQCRLTQPGWGTLPPALGITILLLSSFPCFLTPSQCEQPRSGELNSGKILGSMGPTSALFRWNKSQEAEHQTLTQGLPWSRAH